MAKKVGRNTVQLLIGTRKGAFVAESDRSRRKWKVRGPYHAGADVFHVAADPRHEGHRYALANNAFFGPMIFRSTDGGTKWTEVGTPLMPRRAERPMPEGDPFAVKYPVKNLWHLEPGPESDPSALYLGIDPAMLFRSDDRGESWSPLNGLNEHETRPRWNPGAGGMCLHTILIDPKNPKRMYVGISAAGTFRSDDAGEHWRPANKGVVVSFQPEKRPEVGQCVHDVTMDPAQSETLYRQDHDGVYVSHDGMESWKHVGGKLDSDFGFVVAAPPAAPGEAFFVPLAGNSRTNLPEGLQVWRWTDKSKKWSRTMRPNQFPGTYGNHREALGADALDPFGLYFGTTTGQLFFTRDGARSWAQLPYNFPSIHSVSVANPPL